MNQGKAKKHIISPEIWKIIIGAIAGSAVTLIINLLKDGISSFHVPQLVEIPETISNIYFYAPTPLRTAYYAWITLFILYSYADRFDYYHCNLPRKVKENNFNSWMLSILGMLAVINHTFLLGPGISKFPMYIVNSGSYYWTIFLGYFSLILGFYIVFSARPIINGCWGPHLYEYKYEKDNKLVESGIYGKMRHPIYVGQFLMSCATFLLSNSWIIILFPIYVLIINIKRAENEERHLEEVFGEKYIEYKSRVGKWFYRFFN